MPDKVPFKPGGPPPLDSPWRCTATLRSGRRCRSYSMATPETRHLNPNDRKHKRVPSGLCYMHSRYYDPKVHTSPRGHEHMPHYYKRVLNTALQARVEAALREPAAEQLALNEELALMREGASEAVRMYSQAEHIAQLAEQTGDPAQLDNAQNELIRASHLMMSKLEQVAGYTMQIARIEAMASDNLTVHTVYGILAQVTRIFFDVCGTEHEHLAREVERRVREDVKVPGSSDVQGTDLRPDDDVQAMDDLVPTEPES